MGKEKEGYPDLLCMAMGKKKECTNDLLCVAMGKKECTNDLLFLSMGKEESNYLKSKRHVFLFNECNKVVTLSCGSKV